MVGKNRLDTQSEATIYQNLLSAAKKKKKKKKKTKVGYRRDYYLICLEAIIEAIEDHATWKFVAWNIEDVRNDLDMIYKDGALVV